MAVAPEPVTVRHAPLVAFLRTVPVSDTDSSPKFEFLGAAVIAGRKVGMFSRHPDLWPAIDKYKFYLENLNHYYRTGDSSRLFSIAP